MLWVYKHVNKLPALLILTLHWLIPDVLASHFRGGIIMVRPVDGGEQAAMVNYYIHTTYLRNQSNRMSCQGMHTFKSRHMFKIFQVANT